MPDRLTVYGETVMADMDVTPALVQSAKWKRRLLVGASAVAIVAACVALKWIGGRENARAQQPSGKSAIPQRGNSAPQQAADATSSQQPVVAVVNNEEIHRQELAQECLSQYGKEVLETVMNKYLILSYCERKGIKVTGGE